MRPIWIWATTRRFIDENLHRESNATTGSIYQSVIAKERRGDFLGKTVQVIPHITDEIKDRIKRLATDSIDVVITEIGGTVGDIEILPFLEAIRQFRKDIGRDNVCYVHVTLVPYLGPSGEQKTKPTQHSVTELRSRGIQPDVIICRSDRSISSGLKRKISNLSDVPVEGVISCMDAPNLYEIPLALHEEGLDNYVCRLLGLGSGGDGSEGLDLSAWEALVDSGRGGHPAGAHRPDRQVRQPSRRLPVGGRGAAPRRLRPRRQDRSGMDPGRRGGGPPGCRSAPRAGRNRHPGRLRRARAWKERWRPQPTPVTTRFRASGLCLGLQVMVIEFARNVAGLTGANSREFDAASPHLVIDLMDEQREVVDMGGTMRLGVYPAKLAAGSVVAGAYGAELVYERHRHRFEVNPRYRGRLEAAGLFCSGNSLDDRLVEFIELPGHPVLGRDSGPPRVQEPARQPASPVPGAGRRRPGTGRGPGAPPDRPRRPCPRFVSLARPSSSAAT